MGPNPSLSDVRAQVNLFLVLSLDMFGGDEDFKLHLAWQDTKGQVPRCPRNHHPTAPTALYPSPGIFKEASEKRKEKKHSTMNRPG